VDVCSADEVRDGQMCVCHKFNLNWKVSNGRTEVTENTKDPLKSPVLESEQRKLAPSCPSAKLVSANFWAIVD